MIYIMFLTAIYFFAFQRFEPLHKNEKQFYYETVHLSNIWILQVPSYGVTPAYWCLKHSDLTRFGSLGSCLSPPLAMKFTGIPIPV